MGGYILLTMSHKIEEIDFYIVSKDETIYPVELFDFSKHAITELGDLVASSKNQPVSMDPLQLKRNIEVIQQYGELFLALDLQNPNYMIGSAGYQVMDNVPFLKMLHVDPELNDQELDHGFISLLEGRILEKDLGNCMRVTSTDKNRDYFQELGFRDKMELQKGVYVLEKPIIKL